MFDEPTITDWPEEFDAIVAKLGSPLSVHHFPIADYRRRMVRIWIFLVSALIWLYIGIWITHWFRISIASLFIINLVFFAFAVWLLYTTWRQRRFFILRYDTGIVSWRRGRILITTWDEIELLHIKAVGPNFVVFKPTATGVPCLAISSMPRHWLTRVLPIFRLFYQQIRLMRRDGTEIKIPSYLAGFPVLIESLQVSVYNAIWSEIWRKYIAEEEIEFKRAHPWLMLSWRTVLKFSLVHPVRISRIGVGVGDPLHKRSVFISWSQIKTVKADAVIVFETFSEKNPVILLGAVGWFDNPHVFIHLLNEGLRMHRDWPPIER